MKGRVAIITGAARGIGREIALKLAGEGADVVAVDLLEDDLKETVKLLTDLGVKAVAKMANVTDAKATVNYATYGALYNWTAAKTACPEGWHLPSDAEWMQLTDFLGGVYVAGGKLKETDTIHWKSPNVGATNETSFTALPGGIRLKTTGGGGYTSFHGTGDIGYWWTSTEDSSNGAWYRILRNSDGVVNRSSNLDRSNGFSVRCLRDID